MISSLLFPGDSLCYEESDGAQDEQRNEQSR